MKKHTLLLGAHLSVSKGFDKAIDQAEEIGCTTFQIFTKSNRQWGCKPITMQEADLFKKKIADTPFIKSVTAHASYLINLASSKQSVRTQSRSALMQELQRCHQLGIPFLVLHPGSHGELSKQEGLAFVIEALNEIITRDDIPATCMILLETMAGQGTSLCSTFDEVAYILKNISKSDRVGVCLDTCHIFAAGYDLRTTETYEHTWNEFERIIGLSNLKIIHCNDSKKEIHSRRDRHEVIGQGLLGDNSFTLLFNDTRFFDIPKILETPKASLDDDLKSMQHIVTLLDEKTKNDYKVYVKGI